jgi:uncharacterized protein
MYIGNAGFQKVPPQSIYIPPSLLLETASRSNPNHITMVSEAFIRAEFAPWETENPIPFFEKLPDNVSWTVSGSFNQLAGHYDNKNEVLAVFGRLMSNFAKPPTCKITNVLPSGDYAVVEMTTHGVSNGGKNYDQMLCWVCRYEGDTCVKVTIYVDTAAEIRLFEESSSS